MRGGSDKDALHIDSKTGKTKAETTMKKHIRETLRRMNQYEVKMEETGRKENKIADGKGQCHQITETTKSENP